MVEILSDAAINNNQLVEDRSAKDHPEIKEHYGEIS